MASSSSNINYDRHIVIPHRKTKVSHDTIFKIDKGPIIVSAGHRWEYRVRIDYTNSVMLFPKGVIGEIIDKKTKSKTVIETSRSIFSLQQLRYYSNFPLSDDANGKIVLDLRGRTFSPSEFSSVGHSIVDIIGISSKYDDNKYSITFSGHLQAPYMIMCSLGKEIDLQLETYEPDSSRLCHIFFPPVADGKVYSEKSDWQDIV